MKTRLPLLQLFFVLVVTLLLYSCRKDFDLTPNIVQKVHYDDNDVLAKAQEWYKNNVQRVSKPGDIDVRLLTPDWDNYQLNKNSAGQPWISVPLKNKAHEGIFLTELSFIIDKKGRVNQGQRIKKVRNHWFIHRMWIIC